MRGHIKAAGLNVPVEHVCLNSVAYDTVVIEHFLRCCDTHRRVVDRSDLRLGVQCEVEQKARSCASELNQLCLVDVGKAYVAINYFQEQAVPSEITAVQDSLRE